ncbi:hypothetical protein B296_00032244 [Ensete ventricosum]|uniref:Aminopeptidase P N-terminal domain-containing protein n=1 Tax=Ensete ventricosum TaxID=4639 RepID=A0A426Z125_ENSVE|nr:hypothetical protein B296_00032244 [Ensete ventricosum]
MIGWGFYFGVGVRGLGVAEAVGRSNGESKSGKAPYRPRPRTARYIPVRQLTGTRTGRYRVKKRKRRKKKKYLAVVLACVLPTRPRSPRATIVPVRGDETSPRARRETELVGEDEITPGIATDEYISRRKRLLELLPENSLAIIASAPVKMMTDVVPYPYRQDADFLYITGCLQPGGIAVLSEECGLCMFMPDPDPHVSPKPSSHVSLIPIYGVSEPVMSKLNIIGVFAKIHSLVLPCKIFLGDICYI